MKKRNYLISGIIFLVAFLLRFWYLKESSASPFFIPSEFSLDPYLYHRWAGKILSGHWFWPDKSVLYALPLYPYFLALAYKIFANSVFLTKLCQLFLGSIHCVLIYQLARRIFPHPAAIIAGVSASIYSMFIFYEELLIPSVLVLLLNTIFLLLLTKLEKEKKTRYFFGAGILLGLSGLVAANILLFTPFILLWSKRSVKHLAVFLLAVVLIIAPVTLRNLKVGGELVPISAHAGINFYIGNNDATDGSFIVPQFLRFDPEGLIEDAYAVAANTTGKRLAAAQFSSFWFKQGFKWIRTNPAKYAALTTRKIALYFNSYEMPDVMDPLFFKRYSRVLKLPLLNFGIIFPFAVLGMLAAFHEKKKIKPLVILIAVYFVSTILFFVNSRYRLAAIPSLIILAGYGVYWLWHKIEAREYKFFINAIIMVLALALMAHAQVPQRNLANCHNILSNIYETQGELDKAIEEAKKAIELEPLYVAAHNNLGIFYERQGEQDLAIKEYKIAIGLNPAQYETRFNLGLLYQEKGKYPEAINEYKRAIYLRPNFADGYAQLADLLRKLGKYQDAQLYYQKAREAKKKLEIEGQL